MAGCSSSAARASAPLLAVLLLHANEVVSVDRLIDELWGRSPPATAGKILQVYVSRLRKELGDGRLLTRAPGYVLRADRSELDFARFEQLMAKADMADPRAAASELRRALALSRGPPLADLEYEPFAQAEIVRLEELRWTALELRIDADLAAGRHADADRRARGADRGAPAQGAPARPADARALPLWPPGRGAGGVPPRAACALGAAGTGARRGAEAARAGDPATGSAAQPAGGRPAGGGECPAGGPVAADRDA